MERDKLGRFVKKANNGTKLNPYTRQRNNGISVPILTDTSLDITLPDDVSLSSPLGLSSNLLGISRTPNKLKYYFNEKGIAVDQTGKEIPIYELNKYEYDPSLKNNILDEENSAGVNEVYGNRPIKDFIGSALSKPIDKEKLANFLELNKYGIAASINKKMAERSLKAEKPFLQDVSESHRSIYGDYRAQMLGEQSAALLRNMASKPLTSDGALLQQMMMDAQIKGQEFINQGNAQDEALIKQTREIAWQQEKENLQQRQAVATQNKHAMLMSEKNKAQIENTRDSAMQSMVIDPLLSSREQRLRNEAVEQQANQDYYYEKMLPREVLNTIELTDPKQNALRTLWVNLGYEGVLEAIAAGTYTQTEFDLLSRLINDEILKRQMDYKGVSLNNPPSDPFAFFQGSLYPIHKTGGTIYKAKLVKRTRDNDRAAKSIESSKKIAARFLEKVLDSLYTYKEVELIAKPKKKRKYLSGGGIPFVGATPVFATSERGATQLKKKEESEDEGLSTKDILELLKDMDGLPADMQLIIQSLKNFSMRDRMDPLGLNSSSNLASQYMNIINKIKIAKFNREEYNNAFNLLKGNGGLNELAVTSNGYLIGTNENGDFEYFTPEEIFNKEHVKKEYTLLTNSNLLYLRANSNDAAFNHKLITVAQNGIGIETVNKLITDAITSLGTVTSSEEGYVKTKQGELIKGLDDFYKAVLNSDGNFNGTINDLYKGKFLTKSLAESAKKAISYIYNTLPTNARALLKIKSDGSEEGALKLIETLITTKEDKQTLFDLELVGGKTHKTTNTTNKDNSDLESSLPLNVLKNIGGIDSYIDIDKGDGIHMSIRGTQFNQIKTPSGEPISDTSLSTMLQNSGLQSIVKDMRSIQFGDQKISPEALSFITYNNTGLTRANLPIKSDGSVNLDLLELYENAERDIELFGDKSLENIKSIYEQYGITSLLNADGTYNQSKFAPFIITEGYTTDALSGIQTSEFVREYQGNSDAAVALMQKSLAVGTGKNIVTPEVDEFSWYNPADWFGWTDTIFKGVIYIPITNNVNTAIYGANQNIDYDEALLQEEKYLNFEKMSDLRSTSADLLNI